MTKVQRKRHRARLKLWERVNWRRPWLHWRELEIINCAKIKLTGDVGIVEGIKFIESR
jgi:hypothetical protein